MNLFTNELLDKIYRGTVITYLRYCCMVSCKAGTGRRGNLSA